MNDMKKWNIKYCYGHGTDNRIVEAEYYEQEDGIVCFYSDNAMVLMVKDFIFIERI